MPDFQVGVGNKVFFLTFNARWVNEGKAIQGLPEVIVAQPVLAEESFLFVVEQAAVVTREQKLKETEWEMHERAIAAAKRGLDAYMEREKVYANLADIARMLEIASKLGRLATGLGDGEHRKGDDLPAVRVEVTVALEKIYGEPIPGEIVDVEEVKP